MMIIMLMMMLMMMTRMKTMMMMLMMTMMTMMMTTRETEDSMRPALFSAMQVKVPASSFTNVSVVKVPVV